jgi:FkbM family methyltransferase
VDVVFRAAIAAMVQVRDMADSYSLSVLEQSIGVVQDYLQRKSQGAMPAAETPPVGEGLGLAHRANSAIAHIGLHMSRMSVHESAMREALLGYDPIVKDIALGTVLEVQRHPRDFDDVYEALADQASRAVFDWFLSYRVGASFLGQDVEEVFPSPLSRERWVELLAEASRTFAHDAYHLDGVTLNSGLAEVVTTFLLRQYELPGIVEVKPGDVVLDCGAYRGETALWFAKLAGPTGRVIAFEPVLGHVVALHGNVQDNLQRNLAPVDTVEAAVASNAGILGFNSAAEGSSRVDPTHAETVPCVTLDETVTKLGLNRVGFIKMDIEGGEVDALMGAQVTLRTFTPNLAISVYHKPRDLPDIVAVIRQVRPDYQFYLSHKSPGLAETVLFARCNLP